MSAAPRRWPGLTLSAGRKAPRDGRVDLDADAQRCAEPDPAVADVGKAGGERRAQGIGVGIDLEQAVAARRGEQVRRSEQADAGAQVVRAVAPAGGADPIRAMTGQPPEIPLLVDMPT